MSGNPVAGGTGNGAARLDHIAIAVRDADAALGWYLSALGMVVRSDEYVADVAVRLVYLTTSDAANLGPANGSGRPFVEQAAVQLVQPVGDGPVDRFIRERGEGLHHVCFTVDDVTRTLERLAKTGSGTAAGAVPFRGGRGRRACFLDDTPNNVLVELTDAEPSAQPVAWATRATVNGHGGTPFADGGRRA